MSQGNHKWQLGMLNSEQHLSLAEQTLRDQDDEFQNALVAVPPFVHSRHTD
jgi:hypothetical protein